MTIAESRTPIAPGQPAPDYRLPAVDRDEMISLADYRGRSPLFLALYIGLWCPFCRRSIAKMKAMIAEVTRIPVICHTIGKGSEK